MCDRLEPRKNIEYPCYINLSVPQKIVDLYTFIGTLCIISDERYALDK